MYCFSGARNGNEKAGPGRGEEKKGGFREKAAGGNKPATETHRPGGENAREAESTGENQKTKTSESGYK